MTTERPIHAFSVQQFHPESRTWRVINDRIFVRNFSQNGGDHAAAVARARTEADRQVTGWSAGFPRKEYRAVPVYL